MGIQKKGLGVLCLLLTLCLLLSGCRESSSLVRYDISNGVESLDPQFASEENEQLVIYNMMEGLMRQKPSGELTNGAIERYEVSDDQKVYTFFLVDGMVWDDKENTPVTAHDFVFAFQRIFNSIYPSPFASMFSSLLDVSNPLMILIASSIFNFLSPCYIICGHIICICTFDCFS